MTTNKPWLEHYDPGVPATIEYPGLCVQDLLHQQAKTNPKRTAIIDGELTIDYETLSHQALNFARNLINEGFHPGDRVGICLPNSIEFAVAFFGVLSAGGIVAALNPMFPRRELEFQIKTVTTRYLITISGRLDDFSAIKNTSSLEKIIVVKNHDSSPDINTDGYATGSLLEYSKIISEPKNKIELSVVTPDQPAVFQFSGGTTGTPKAAIGTHRNIVANVTQFKSWLVNIREGETFLVAIPLYHVYGMVLGLNLGIAMGAKMVFVRDPRDIDNVLNLIQKYRVSYFPAVPSTFHMINQHPGVKDGKIDLSKIKACISGSAPLPNNVRILFEDNTGGHLVEGYGLSEAPTATHCNPILGENREGSIGLPLPDVECRIVNMDGSDLNVEQGEAGELLIKAPQIMLGYYGNESESGMTLRNGWLHTGDIARMDTDGYFYLLGRLKELIKVHGLQVWPAEVEEVVHRFPGVKECVVAGIPDPSSGERVKVWIVAEDGEAFTLSQIQDFCRGELVGYKVPTEFEVIDVVPRSAVGKVLRRELVRRHMESK